jgi:glucose-6-phosphate 1-dehydrogenase
LENVSILAIGRKPLSSIEFRAYLQKEAILKTESLDDRDDFFSKIDYLDLPINDPNGYEPLSQFTRMYPEKNIVFYLSTPPELFEPIVAGIANA